MDVSMPIASMTLPDAKRSLLLQLKERTLRMLELAQKDIPGMSDDEVTMHVRDISIGENNLDLTLERIQILEP